MYEWFGLNFFRLITDTFFHKFLIPNQTTRSNEMCVLDKKKITVQKLFE